MLPTPPVGFAAYSPAVLFGAEKPPIQAVSGPTGDAAATLKTRIRGAILAQACGDALGAGVEFLTPAQIRSVYPQGLKDIVGSNRLSPIQWQAGEYTDDTKMMVDMAEALLAFPQDEHLAQRDMLRRWVDWKNSNPPDIGNLTLAALNYGEALLANPRANPTEGGRRAWEDSGRQGAGNGGVMRAAPVALMYFREPEKLARMAAKGSAITHYDPRCQASVVAFSLMLADILNGQIRPDERHRKQDLEAAFQRIAARVHPQSPEVAQAILKVPGMDEREVSTSGYTIHTMQAGLWTLYHCNSVEDGLVTLVNKGDDADTAAAVAGALLGALHGEEGIPERFVSRLQERRYLENLSDRLFQALG